MTRAYNNILLIDNFDSFTYNLVDYLRRLGCNVQVYRNTVEPEQLAALDFDLLMFSPGPALPAQAGNMLRIIGYFHTRKPMLGICLGHQAIVEFFGGSLKNTRARHGKAETIVHDGKTLYHGLPDTVEVARYHSWSAGVVPGVLEVTSRAQDGTVMGVRHKFLPIEGVQFHPESVLSMRGEAGYRMLKNLVIRGLGTGFQDYQALMERLQHAGDLLPKDLERYVDAISAGRLADDHQLVLLVALAFRLQAPEALADFCRVLLSRAQLGQSDELQALGKTAVDVCGTGGSGLPRLNTSTLASLILSGMGLPILKHGNRAASGRYGSSDLLADLGLPLDVPEVQLLEAFHKHKLAFIYARQSHPVVGKLAQARARVGIPTLFNVLGPLLNPYQPTRQLVGTAFESYQQLIFKAGIALGRSHLLVVRGLDGLDEISLSAPTQVLSYHAGERQNYTISPTDFGLDTIPFERLSAPRLADSLHLAQAMIAGDTSTDHHKLVAANAAFAYHHFVAPIGLPEAYAKMIQAIQGGVLAQQLDALKATLTKSDAMMKGKQLQPA